MPDNTTLPTSDAGGDPIVTREISHGGDTSKLPGSFIMGISGSEGAYTAAAINGDATNGMDVDVTRVSGTVTVAGTVTSELSATDNAVLDAIAASVAGTLTVGTHAVTGPLTDAELRATAVPVSGTFWQATQPVSGTVTANAGSGTFTVSGAVTNTVLSVVGGGTEATAQRVTIASDSTGVLSVDDNGGSITVDGTVAVSGTVTVGSHDVTNAGTFAVQAAQSGTWDVGTVTAVTTVTNLSQLGGAAVPIGTGVQATAIRVLLPSDGDGKIGTLATLTTLTGSAIAHDAADSSANNPHKIGVRATSSVCGETPVATADRTQLYGGLDGVLITRPHCNLEDIVTGNATNTDGTATQCIAAQAAGIKTYLTSVVLANSSASNITVEIKDGTTVKTTIPVPAGGGAVYNPVVPIPGTAATAWNFDPSAAATTVTCSMIGFKSKL